MTLGFLASRARFLQADRFGLIGLAAIAALDVKLILRLDRGGRRCIGRIDGRYRRQATHRAQSCERQGAIPIVHTS